MATRVIMGQRFDGSYGLDIGRPGFDIEAADPLSEPEKYAFSSRWDRLEKIRLAGVTRVTFSAASVSVLLNLTEMGINEYPLIDYQLRNVSTGRIEDNGWYKYDYSGADPSYSSRIAMEMWVSGGIRYVGLHALRDGGSGRPLNGNWDVCWVMWKDCIWAPGQ